MGYEITEQDKRDELRQKIEEAEARNKQRSLADYAKEAQESATKFVKERPLTTVAGVAVAGLLIGAMTRPGRRVARQAGTRALSLGTLAAEMAALYGARAMDGASDMARSSQDTLEDFGEDLGRKARGMKRSAGYTAAETGDSLRTISRRTGRKTTRTFRDLTSRLR